MWRQYDGTRHLVLARRFTVGTGWGPTTLLMIPSIIEEGISPQLAMDPQGNAFVVWQQFDGRAYGIWAARFSKASGWERLDIINSPNLGDSLEPKIGFDAAGNAVAVWRRIDLGLNSVIVRASYYDARTGWGRDETISTGRGVAETLELAVSPSGFATAIWFQSENNVTTTRSSTRIP
jgi:hypothetical protein